jgi:DDE superfamily endonuclease
MTRQPARHLTSDPVAAWMAPFAPRFTRPTFANLLVLVTGALLAPGRRTVAAALSIVGRREAATFTNFHRVLNRDRWPGQALARTLFGLLAAAFVPTGPVVIGIDETIERRWGRKIKARGIYRDPVRSSKGHFAKASGLRWISLMLLAPIPFTRRVWALPFLTALAPSERFAEEHGRRYKPLTDRARQLLRMVARWLPDRPLVAVADTTYAAIALLAAVRARLTVITRLRLDARLFDPPPARRPGQRGRPALKGARQPTLEQRVADAKTAWQRMAVTGWYGDNTRELDIASGTALWYHPGLPPVPVRWVLVRDVAGEHEPQAFLCTDAAAEPVEVLRLFVRRWSMEVTFAEVRRHLGVETQRQWSDNAVARTTPSLMALFSLVTVWSTDLGARGLLLPRQAAWYPKRDLTFSDALAAVRRQLWITRLSSTSPTSTEMAKIPHVVLECLTDAACYPA